MRRIELTAKKGGLGQKKLNELQSAKYARLDAEERKHSTGVFGKDYEPNVRHLLAKCGLTKNDFHCRENGSNTHYIEDGVIWIDGVRLRYEIKTGDGIIGSFEATETPIFDEDLIFPGIDLVIYTCEPRKMESEADIKNRSLVLTRSEFIQFISTEGPKNKQCAKTATKFGINDHYYRDMNNEQGTKYRDCIILQPSYRKARESACKSERWMKLGEFIEKYGR
jgi:hypothetical protein